MLSISNLKLLNHLMISRKLLLHVFQGDLRVKSQVPTSKFISFHVSFQRNALKTRWFSLNRVEETKKKCQVS